MRFPLIIFLILFMTIPTSMSQIPNLPGYDPVEYYGLEYGASGISNIFLRAIRSEIFDENTVSTIFNSVLRSMEAVWEHRSEINEIKVPTWSKGPSFDSNYIYPGVKYGAAGIIPTFLDLYEYSQDQIWLDRAIQSYNELFRQSIGSDDLPRWAYAYNYPKEEYGLSLTGIKYGNMGIVKLCITMYQFTGNSTYLEQAEKIVNYQKSISKEVNVGVNKYSIIPWYYHPDTTINPINTGYNMGIAGIADVLLELGNVASRDDFIDLAYVYADFLVQIQKSDGSWNAIFMLDESLTNFEEGVVGVIYGLAKVNEKYDNPDVLNAIENGIVWLFEQQIRNSTHTFFPNYSADKAITCGLYNGNLGIVSTLMQLFNYLNDEQKNNLGAAINWITGKCMFSSTVDNQNIAFLRQPGGQFLDTSYSTGNAGLIDTLLDLYFSRDEIVVLFNLKEVILGLISCLIYLQGSNDLWVRHIPLPTSWDLQYISALSDIDNPYITTSDTDLTGFPIPLFIIMAKNVIMKKKNSQTHTK